MSDESGVAIPRYFDEFVALAVRSEDHNVTIEPANDYGWLIYVDGESVTPAGPDQGLAWESFTLGDGWQNALSDQQREHIAEIAEESGYGE